MEQGGLFSYIRAYDEFLNHNVESVEKRYNFQKPEEIAELPKRKKPCQRNRDRLQSICRI